MFVCYYLETQGTVIPVDSIEEGLNRLGRETSGEVGVVLRDWEGLALEVHWSQWFEDEDPDDTFWVRQYCL